MTDKHKTLVEELGLVKKTELSADERWNNLLNAMLGPYRAQIGAMSPEATDRFVTTIMDMARVNH
jgi:hypothetical protein